MTQMSREPLLSLVIPWHECERVEETLQQVARLHAKGSLIECILVDDASQSDSSRQIVKDWSDKEWLKVLQLSVRSGPGVARNEGAKLATGSYVLFSDADDHPSIPRILAISSAAGELGLDWVGFDYTFTAQNDGQEPLEEHAGPVSLVTGSRMADILEDLPAVWRFIFRRDFLLEAPACFPALRYGEDLVFLLELADEPSTGATCPLASYTHDVSPDPRRLTRHAISERQVRDLVSVLETIARNAHAPDVCILAQSWALRVWLRNLPRSSRVPIRFSRQYISSFPLPNRRWIPSIRLLIRMASVGRTRRNAGAGGCSS